MNKISKALSDKVKTYNFQEYTHCNMCLSSKDQFKLLGRRLDKAHGYSPKKKVGVVNTIMRCKNCQVVFANPLPIPNDIQDHYNMDPTEYWPKEYFNIAANEFRTQIDHLKKIKGINNGDKYLDIGAGLGKVMIVLEKEGMDVYGIEPSEAFHRMAIEKMGIDKSKIQLTDIERASFESNYFDFISFGAVLEHLYYPGESILKAMEWLKPGGVIQIEVPNSQYLLTKCLNLFNKIRMSEYVSHLSPMHPPFHLYEFSTKTFEKHAELNGYTVLDQNIDVCTTPGPKLLSMILDPIMNMMNTGMQLTVWLQKN